MLVNARSSSYVCEAGNGRKSVKLRQATREHRVYTIARPLQRRGARYPPITPSRHGTLSSYEIRL